MNSIIRKINQTLLAFSFLLTPLYAVANAKEAGSFLVLLANDAQDKTATSLDTLLREGISPSVRQETIQEKERAFAQVDGTVRQALLNTPGLEKVHSYPALMSYVVYVKNTETASAYLEKLAQQQPAIAQVDEFHAPQPELDVSPHAILIRTNDNPIGDGWWTNQIPLKPITIGVLDDGVNIHHPMFVAHRRNFYCQPATDPAFPVCGKDLPSAHGTSMAGIYFSRFPVYAGINSLPGTDEIRDTGPIKNILVAKAGEETVDGRKASLQGLHWLLTQRENPRVFPEVINYSQGNGWICPDGSECNPLAYTSFEAIIDTVIDEFGISFIKSAGNNGYKVDKTTMTVPSGAYNLIAVANLNPFDWKACARGGDRDEFKIHLSSSVSPPYAELDSNGARRLLTVAAPGRSINTAGLNPAYCIKRCEGDAECETSCASLGVEVPGYDPKEYGYWRKSTGTSPAAPMVGAVASWLKASDVKHPAAVKAVIVNSASSWTSSDNANPPTPEGTDCSNDIAKLHHPVSGTHYDRTYGWGLLDASKAYKQRENVFLDTIHKGQVKSYIGSLEDFEKITLVWQKHFGHKLTQLNLSLYYKKGNSWIPVANDITVHNNVKQVSNGNPNMDPIDAEQFMLTVTPVGDVPKGGEVFALASDQRFKKYKISD